MATVTRVPLNTMLADLDESLKTLLKRELGRHGFDGVEIAFDAPDKEWSAALSTPTVNLFLYDLREAIDRRPIEWDTVKDGNGRARDMRPPLRVDAAYAVTAWTRVVQDEHRLLSQVLAVLYAYADLPGDVLTGTLADPNAQRFPLTTRIAQARQEGAADFWSAVGGQYKASLDYIVTVSCEPGTAYERGPETRTATIRLSDKDLGRTRVEEMNNFGGVVRDEAGDPVANAWVALREKGAFAVTGRDGRFRFERVTAGRYTVAARGPDGTEAEAEVDVPGAGAELALGKPKAGAKGRR